MELGAAIGSLLVAYGLWRGYRQFTGIDYPDDNKNE